MKTLEGITVETLSEEEVKKILNGVDMSKSEASENDGLESAKEEE